MKKPQKASSTKLKFQQRETPENAGFSLLEDSIVAKETPEDTFLEDSNQRS